jgi:hypothetical protein
MGCLSKQQLGVQQVTGNQRTRLLDISLPMNHKLNSGRSKCNLLAHSHVSYFADIQQTKSSARHVAVRPPTKERVSTLKELAMT